MAITDRPELDDDLSIEMPDVAGIVADVRAVYDSGRTRPMAWRHAQLDGLLRLLREEAPRLEEALAADLGRSPMEAFAADIGATASEIAHIRKHVEKWATPRKVRLPINSRPGSGQIVPEPLGVALVVSPWNYPVQLLLLPIAAAIAAGNAVVAKPSEIAPATSAVVAELLPRYLDDEAIVVVEGDVPVATELLEQRFDHIFYTGSTSVGRIVYQAAARHLTPVTLELGGKSPVLIDPSANLDVAARRLAWGKWLNAGQTCVAPDYVLVTEAQRDELVDKMQAAFADFTRGATAGESDDFSSIVTERHAGRLAGLLDGHGGTIAFGGTVDVEGKHVEPTVIVDPDLDSPVMTEEIFGPILPVVTVESMDDAVAVVNGREKPLALYVFAEDSDAADALLDATSSGGACVNHVLIHITPPDLPFGGVGEAGFGRYHGQSGFETFSNLKSVMRKPTKPDPSILYPPYTGFKEKLIRKFL
ncbi:MAG: aldehyde dehydrogenase family protein [Actinomycetota bacterium]